MLMKSVDIKDKSDIIPISERKRFDSISLKSPITGLIELKNGFYFACSQKAKIGIFNHDDLKLIGKLKLDKDIKKIYHISKIKDENLDLIAIGSNLNDIIIISVFPKRELENLNPKNTKENNNNEGKNEKEDEDDKEFEKDEYIRENFGYKIECKIEGHSNNVNRIIQLTNNYIVSASKDGYVIFWEKTKSNNLISLKMIKKINFEKNIYSLIECTYTNELICNNQTIDLNSFELKRKLDISYPSDHFNCGICLFKGKFIASFGNDCELIDILNIENNDNYTVEGKYDYVEAVYTIDNETFCLNIQNLNSMGLFGWRFSQQFKLNEKRNKFKEIGEITLTGTCNIYMNDSDGNFVMGDMSGHIIKFLNKSKNSK